MSLGDILHTLEDAFTGTVHDEAPAEVDPNADPVYDKEQGIQSSAADPYGDPADQNK